jgi:hypothetical protein
LTMMAATLVVASGVALAVNKIGTNGPDTLKGTNGADKLLGKGGNDVLGLFNKPAKRDFVTCGRGFDRVLADTEDLVAPDCEKVAVGLAVERRLLWWRLQRPNISWVAWRSVRDGPH